MTSPTAISLWFPFYFIFPCVFGSYISSVDKSSSYRKEHKSYVYSSTNSPKRTPHVTSCQIKKLNMATPPRHPPPRAPPGSPLSWLLTTSVSFTCFWTLYKQNHMFYLDCSTFHLRTSLIIFHSITIVCVHLPYTFYCGWPFGSLSLSKFTPNAKQISGGMWWPQKLISKAIVWSLALCDLLSPFSGPPKWLP